MSRARFLRKQAERLRAAREQSTVQLTQIGVEPEPAERTPDHSTVEGWQSWIEQQIQRAMAAGQFDNLQGAGKPLNLFDDEDVPEFDRMAFRVLRSNGLAPQWIESYKDVQDDLARLARFRALVGERWATLPPADHSRLRDEFAARVAAANSRILTYNLQAPASHIHLPLLILAEQLAAFDAETVGAQP